MSDFDNNTVILITRNGMGDGDPQLQQKLIGIYLNLLLDSNLTPGIICFYADGVKLVVQGSPVLEQLRELEKRGVHLVICSTCLNYYNLENQVQVGIAGGMTDILEAQRRATKIIAL
ncbi:MAG: DsrE family protein [Anaerolineales bacterium]